MDELADLQEHILSMTKDLHGDSSGELIEAINSAADIFAKAKQFDKSKALLKEGVLVASRVWGESGTRTINLLSSLAELYIRQQRYADAEILFRKMLEQHQKRSPLPSLALGEIYTKLADSLSLQKNYEAAEGNYKLAVENIEGAAGQDHHDTLLPLSHLANLYMMTGKYKEAERCYKRVLEIRYKTSGEDSDETVNSLLRLADLYNLQSEFAESEVFLESAMETAVKIYPEQDVRLAEVMQQYAKLLKRLGRMDEVAKLEARAEAIKAGLTTGQYYTINEQGEPLHRDDEKQRV
jgi:tetratricopeptide (TPR) repeat protein